MRRLVLKLGSLDVSGKNDSPWSEWSDEVRGVDYGSSSSSSSESAES